jgi:hypothetical protein
MAGYAYGDVDCWETAWRSYCGEVGTSDARRLMGELQFWVRTLRAESARDRPLPAWLRQCLPRRVHGAVAHRRAAGS